MNKIFIILIILVIIVVCYFLFKKKRILPNKLPKVIYMFWDKGFDNAPNIVKECLLSWEHYNPNWEIITLDKKNIYNYLSKELLDNILKKKLIQHQADIIRVNLLNEYGGVWVDSTIFCNKPLDSWIHDYMDSGFFCFKYSLASGLSPYRLGNWFLASEKKNYIIDTFSKKYNEHWKNRESDNYFGFHNLFDKLCKTNKKFNYLYKKIPFYDARISRVTIFNFYKIRFNLKDQINQDTESLVNNKNIPMFKFRSRDNVPNENIIDTLFEYLINSKFN